MRRSLFLRVLSAGVCLVALDGHPGSAQPLAQRYCNAGFHISCPPCENDTVKGGCWVWGGGPADGCSPDPIRTCDPNQVNVICVAVFYLGGSCSGVSCQPDDCCRLSGAPTTDRKRANLGSCVPP